MRVLVTGATGFIGRRLIAFLRTRHETIAVLRRADDAAALGAAAWVLADLAGPLDADVLPAGVDAVVHLAQANVPFPEAAPELFAVNVAATLGLLDWARRASVPRFVLASSGDVYGPHRTPRRESDAPAPASFYGATKSAAETIAQAYAGYLSPCILRLFRPYGPGQSGRLLPRLAAAVRRGEPVATGLDGGPRLNPIYVDNVLQVIERALGGSFAGIVNVAGDETVTLRELACRLGSVVGREPVFRDDDAAGLADTLGDNRLMHEALGGWPLVPLDEGLSRSFAAMGGELG